MKTFFKIIAIGMAATICRISIQLVLPESPQTVLKPSIFVQNGQLSFAFSLLSFFAYSIITGLILFGIHRSCLDKERQGIAFAFVMSLLWSVYLFEPLPHASSILLDSVVYVLADSLSLLVVGVLIDVLFKNNNKKNVGKGETKRWFVPSLVIPTGLFVLGRLVQYSIFHLYSSFTVQPVISFLWCILTGGISSFVLVWFSRRVDNNKAIGRSIGVGIVIYGLNLLFFNSFMLLVFDFSWLDLLLRTLIDILTVSSGVLLVYRLYGSRVFGQQEAMK